MKLRVLWVIALVLSLAGLAGAQDQSNSIPRGQAGGPGGGAGGYGRRGGGFGGMGMGGGLEGTVTEAAADHFTIKTDGGDLYTVRFSANTRVMKQAAGGGPRSAGGGDGQGQNRAQGMGGMGGMRGNPPEQIKPADVKIGDVIGVMSDPNEPVTNKTVGAFAIVVIDPQTVQRMREMQANFGKTWLAGKVTAISDTTIAITGAADNAPHTVVADENTTFRKRRDPVTLADIQVGDTIRADGAIKGSAFVATTVTVMGGMNGEPPQMPRNAPPQ